MRFMPSHPSCGAPLVHALSTTDTPASYGPRSPTKPERRARTVLAPGVEQCSSTLDSIRVPPTALATARSPFPSQRGSPREPHADPRHRTIHSFTNDRLDDSPRRFRPRREASVVHSCRERLAFTRCIPISSDSLLHPSSPGSSSDALTNSRYTRNFANRPSTDRGYSVRRPDITSQLCSPSVLVVLVFSPTEHSNWSSRRDSAPSESFRAHVPRTPAHQQSRTVYANSQTVSFCCPVTLDSVTGQ